MRGRDPHVERGALPRLTLDLDVTTVLLGDILTDEQAQTQAVGLGGVERLKEPF
jgi:hypothetical protein